MCIFLGNMSLEQMEERLGIKLSDEHRQQFEGKRQEHVNDKQLGDGCWHCFDIPFTLMCDTQETAVRYRDIIQQYSIKGTFSIAWEH